MDATANIVAISATAMCVGSNRTTAINKHKGPASCTIMYFGTSNKNDQTCYCPGPDASAQIHFLSEEQSPKLFEVCLVYTIPVLTLI